MPEEPVQTIHIQTGPEVYIFETDEILPNNQETFQRVYKMKEVQGTAQGQGIETIWWDGTDAPIDLSNAGALQQKARQVRQLLGIPTPGTKESKKIVVKMSKNGRHHGS